jgi:hypothetical protein
VLDENRPVCWSIVVKKKPTVDSQFFGAFLSDRTSKAKKDVNAYFLLVAVTILVNYTSEFRAMF